MKKKIRRLNKLKAISKKFRNAVNTIAVVFNVEMVYAGNAR